MRQRIEDLGRICVLLDNLLEHELFEERPRRNKDYSEWFAEQTELTRDEIIHSMVYRIDNVRDKLYEIQEIAEGNDLLNRPDGESHT